MKHYHTITRYIVHGHACTCTLRSSNSHEVHAAIIPVSLVLGTHLHGLLSQLTTVRVLETTQHKHHTRLEGGRKGRRWVEEDKEKGVEEKGMKGERVHVGCSTNNMYMYNIHESDFG